MLDVKNINSKSVLNFLLNNSIIILMIGASIVVGTQRSNFFSLANLGNLISNTSIRFIVALGVSGCLISRGTDLSAGRAVGLAACLSATFLQRADFSARVYPNFPEFSMIAVLLGVVIIAMLFGLMNGAVIAYLQVPPFITTLGTQTIIYGVCLVFTVAQPIGGLRRDYTALASGVLGNFSFSRALPYLGVFALILGIIMWFVYNRTPHGKYI
jgi:methyl-galactoside transport system permease protein